jgi:menaquinone-specific isochorismate synthase
VTSLASTSVRLQAVTRAIPPYADLLDLLDQLGPDGQAWLHDGWGFVTRGVATRVDVEAADAMLADIEVDDPLGWPGTGPLAVGALPFDPTAPGALVIPNVVIGRTADGRGWVTEIGAPRPSEHGATPAAEPTRWQVASPLDRQRWRAMVRGALHAIDRGELAKVVLARAVVVEADVPFSPARALRHLLRSEPGCFVHHADGVIGASPELLVRRAGRELETRPLAGTVPVADGAVARLQASEKEGREHELVVDGVRAALAPLCARLEVPDGPVPAAFSSVVHLETPIHGLLQEPAPSALVLARRLHPTAAVAGTPCAAALRVIAALEREGRGRYAGPVGWVDTRGDGEWAVALRGAELDANRAVLRAGAGIVDGSDPDAEWAETQAKLEPMLRALVTP